MPSAKATGSVSRRRIKPATAGLFQRGRRAVNIVIDADFNRVGGKIANIPEGYSVACIQGTAISNIRLAEVEVKIFELHAPILIVLVFDTATRGPTRQNVFVSCR